MNPLPALSAALRSLWDRAGFAERRCVACLEPFAPARSPVRSPECPRNGTEPDMQPNVQPDTRGALAGRLCPECRACLPRRNAGYCPRCGEPAADRDAPLALCGQCLQDSPPWEHFRFYGIFEGTLRQLLLRAKFGEDAACLDLLGHVLLEAHFGLPRPDAIVPMPLHPARLRERGYNQCREMARPLARRLGAPLRDDLLFRVRHAAPQIGLSREERQANQKGSFGASPAVSGLRVLLIDDTATTGSTLRAATEALIRAGALAVDVVVVARASIHIPG